MDLGEQISRRPKVSKSEIWSPSARRSVVGVVVGVVGVVEGMIVAYPG